MSKGSKRRRENTALVEANWDSIFGPARTPVPDSQMATDTDLESKRLDPIAGLWTTNESTLSS